MLDMIEQGLAIFTQYGLPTLPYASISLVIYYVMNLIVKPIIASRKNSAGYHPSGFWRAARKGYYVYPMVLGYLASLALPELLWGYCVVAGVCAQAWYFILYAIRAKLKKEGFAMPPAPEPTKYMTSPPGK